MKILIDPAEAALPEGGESTALHHRYAVAPAGPVGAFSPASGVGTVVGGKESAMSNIIGRPNGDLLDVMLGDGADPEQAIINGPEQGNGSEDDRPGDEPAAPEL